MTEISADGKYEWDSEKNEINIRKHGLSFEQVIPVFEDPFFLERYDREHSSEDEDRYFGLGMLQGILIVATSYTENNRTRLISARVATPKEKEVYDEHTKNLNR